MLNQQTWGRWYAEFHESVRRLLRKELRNQSVVDDLAQETFMRLLKYADEDLVENPQAFLFTIARNVARDWAERVANQEDRQVRIDHPKSHGSHNNDGQPVSLLDQWVAEEFMVPSVLVERQDVQYAMREAVNQLTRRQRHLIKRHVYEEKTYNQITKAAIRNGTQSINSHRIVLRELARAFAQLRMTLGNSDTLEGIKNTWMEKSPDLKPPKKFFQRRKKPGELLGPKTLEEARDVCTRMGVAEAATYYKMSKRWFKARLNILGMTGWEAKKLYLQAQRVVGGAWDEYDKATLTEAQWAEMRDKNEYLTPAQTASALGVTVQTLARWRRRAATLGPAYDLPYEETGGRACIASVRYRSEVVQRFMARTENCGYHTRRLKTDKTYAEIVWGAMDNDQWHRAPELILKTGLPRKNFYAGIKGLEQQGRIESKKDPNYSGPGRVFKRLASAVQLKGPPAPLRAATL